MSEFYVKWVVDDVTGLMRPYKVDIIPPTEAGLAVPYHSQWEPDANKWKSDCGPATVEMICKYYTNGVGPSTNDIMEHITGGVNRNTSATELVEAAEDLFGVQLGKVYSSSWDFLKSEIDKGYPSIVLVHYGAFVMRLDRNFTGGHWMVVKGFEVIDYQGTDVERIILHDPDWWGDYVEQGAAIPVVKDMFMNMWELAHLDGNPDRMVLVSRP